MKTKNILLIALIGSVGAGVYYMGRNKIIKNLISQGLINIGADGKYYLNESGAKNLIEVTKEDGTTYYIENKATGNAFDYNNPKYHAGDDYYKSENAQENTKQIKIKTNDINIENGEIKLNVNKDNSVDPTIIDSVVAGIGLKF